MFFIEVDPISLIPRETLKNLSACGGSAGIKVYRDFDVAQITW